MDEKYNGIVIKTSPYRDNDKMLTLFTLENGIISANLRGVKKANAKLKFAGEPFCFGEFSLVEKSQRRTVTEVNQIDSFYNVRLDPDKCYAAFSCCEFVSKFLYSGMKSYDMFLLLVNTLKALNTTPKSPKLLLVYFYLSALGYSGYRLDFSHCFDCGSDLVSRAFFNFDDGVARCLNCCSALDTEIRFSTYQLLKDISNFIDKDSPLEEICDFDDTTVINAIKFIDFYMSQKTGVVIKSHKIFIE